MLLDLQLDSAPGTAEPTPYDGPGSASDRTVDINSNDPLIHLGLVDSRTGAALPTDDWRPPQAQTNSQGQPQARAGDGAGYPAAGGSDPKALSGPTGNAAPAPGSVPAVDPAAQFQTRAALLQAQAAQAYHEAVAAGADAEPTAKVIQAQLQAKLTELRTGLLEQAMFPVAKQQAATLIATRQGMNLVRAEELMAYDTPQAMEAAAQQIATARRAGTYQQRVAQGTDRVEGGQPGRGISAAIAELSPQKKIELGIRRGQYS